ncbi:histidine kinase [Paenibacillus sp. LHD-117]|uniref:sensor histidine kinase n=1 Tax=Paenibacillus sp. LHD-117 TaxID=3071412 RepID=UPI0027E04CCA|nr:histidine kinase [Paenibacillus sp. LHD-117]MDQ6417906.1 histidine kinase [Paenibacillus sp. LHD-117]
MFSLAYRKSRKALKSLPIGYQLSFLVAVIIVVVLVILYANYSKAAEVVEKKNSEYHTEMIAQINRTIASNTDAIKRVLLSIAYNPKIVQRYLVETDPVEKYIQYTNLVSYLTDMKNMKDGILDIALISTDGTTFSLSGDINNLLPIMEEIPRSGSFYFSGVQKMRYYQNRDVFIVGSPILTMMDYDNDKKSGLIMLVLDAGMLLGSPPNQDRLGGSKLYALDRNGSVFYASDPEVQSGTSYAEIASEESDASFFIQKGAIPDIKGELVFKLPRSELLSGVEEIRRLSLTILFAALLLLTVPFLLIVGNILRPLKKLMRFMNDFKLGHLRNLNNRISLQGYAEITSMASDFNRMLDEIDALTKQLLNSNTKLYRAELVKKQSELAFLQSQINPHFLYNTLESIKGMAVDEGSDKIFHMVKSLAFVFRYSIKGADFVTLQEELTLVKSHVHIQQIRFGNRFRVHYGIPESLLACQVPKMILQPLVENAIFHGIEPRTHDGLLEIAAEEREGTLWLTVWDNGAGMDEGQLRTLEARLAAIRDMTDDQRTNIGLVNVNNRLKLYYGDSYGISIESHADAGTKVTITLPIGGDDDVQRISG